MFEENVVFLDCVLVYDKIICLINRIVRIKWQIGIIFEFLYGALDVHLGLG